MNLTDFLPYGRQQIDDDDIQAVIEALKGDFLTTGPKIAEFEAAFNKVTGAPESVVCSNGTTALHLAAMAMGIGPGDAVIVSTLTFLATANAVRYCGADVVFADVDPQTGLMGVEQAREALKRCGDKKPKAIFTVHLGGQCADLEGLSVLAKAHGLYLLADSCHAVGGTYKGHSVGACVYEDFSTFSFHPVKTFTTGEGGAITARKPEHAAMMRRTRSHGMAHRPDIGPWAYDMPDLGYNYRITDFQCALGISQLKKLPGYVARRADLVEIYDRLLEPLAPVVLPPQRSADCMPGWHLYAPRFDFAAAGKTRAQVMTELKERGIGTQVHYIPVHTQPYYRDLYGEIDLPGARHYYGRTLSLPLYPGMRDEDVGRVVEALKDILLT